MNVMEEKTVPVYHLVKVSFFGTTYSCKYITKLIFLKSFCTSHQSSEDVVSFTLAVVHNGKNPFIWNSRVQEVKEQLTLFDIAGALRGNAFLDPG